MNPIAELTPAEMRLLLRYIAIGGEHESTSDTMAMTGVTDRGNFYRARKRLIARGLLDMSGAVLWPPIVIGVTPVQPISEPAPKYIQAIAANPLDLRPADFDVVTHAIEQKSWTQRAMDADLSGNPREQVKVLGEAFSDILGQELTARSAKVLLGLVGGYAEDLIGEFEAIAAKPKKIDYPYSYLKKKLESEAAKTLNAKPATRVVNTDLPETVLADIGPDPDYYLSKPTPRTAELERKLAALGLLDDDEEDDD